MYTTSAADAQLFIAIKKKINNELIDKMINNIKEMRNDTDVQTEYILDPLIKDKIALDLFIRFLKSYKI